MSMHERIYLSDDKNVYLDSLILEPYEGLPKRKAMIVFPGGGYYHLAHHEREVVASRYFANDFNVFVLYYTVRSRSEKMVDENGVPYAMTDALKAIAHVRENADKYGIDPDKISVVGFSAGGHLAATVATMWHDERLCRAAGLKKEQCKPNAALLCYAVMTPDGGDIFDRCMDNLFAGTDNIRETSLYFDTVKRVDKNTCPIFMMHTVEDETVPVENAYLMSEALFANNLPHELYVMPHGQHGIGLCEENTRIENDRFFEYNSAWVHRSIDFLTLLFGEN